MGTKDLFIFLLVLMVGIPAAFGQSRKCAQRRDICVAINTANSQLNSLKTALSQYLEMYKFVRNERSDRIAFCVYADTFLSRTRFGTLRTNQEIVNALNTITSIPPVTADVKLGLDCCAGEFSARDDFTIPDLTILLGFPSSGQNTDLGPAIRTATELQKTCHISILTIKPLLGTQSDIEKIASSSSDLVLFEDVPTLLTDATSTNFPTAFDSLCPDFNNPCDSCATTEVVCRLQGPDCWEYWVCQSPEPPPAIRNDNRYPTLRRTAEYTFWDNTIGSAQHISSLMSACPNDRCKSLQSGDKYGRPDQCRMILTCAPGQITSPIIECCPRGERFIDGRGCVTDATCTTSCEPSPKGPATPRACNRQAIPGDANAFTEGNVRKLCPGFPGFLSAFDQNACACVLTTAQHRSLINNALAEECQPDLDISAAGTPVTVKDRSDNKYWLGSSGTLVPLGGGAFAFTPRFKIWGFAGNDFGDKFAIYTRIRPAASTQSGEAIVANAECNPNQETYSMVLGNSASGVTLTGTVVLNKGGLTLTTPSVNLGTYTGAFTDVVMEYNGQRLALLVGSQTVTAAGTGRIQNKLPPCAMDIGSMPGPRFRSYSGVVEKFVVYKCLMARLEDYVAASGPTGGNYKP